MTVKNITDYIEKIAPLDYAEDFDNVGLLVGNYDKKITGVLVTLDTLEKTLDEAINFPNTPLPTATINPATCAS